DERHAMADEDAIADPDAFADEGVALDLAERTDLGSALYLDECANPSIRPDAAAIQVREGVDHDAVAKGDVVDQPVRGLVDGGSVDGCAVRMSLHEGQTVQRPFRSRA
ncbi:MAG TPA: hypothetical protein VE270_08835, partial [Thermoleophilaceae bacterium]|nr:hypothetical protein [Thermoleophilaceae bacterium]